MTMLVKPNYGTRWMDSFFNNDFAGFQTEFKTPVLVNTKENKESYMLEVAAPGFDKEDFKIDVDNQMLNISVEKKSNVSEQNANDDRYNRIEFRFSSFKRSFQLPKTVDGTKISASYKNGILYVLLPKQEEAKAKAKFEIKID
ncbi:MAG: Hsp20/alpha crystallin family protein [Chitinophagales bacterium]